MGARFRDWQGEHLNMKHEKRARVRIPYQTTVNIKVDGRGVVPGGNLCNISMKGMLVDAQLDLPLGTPCRVEIVHCGDHGLGGLQ